jgi:hypothetical protein
LVAQQKRRVVQRVLREVGEGLGLDLEDFAALEGRGAHALLREQAVLGVVGAERERLLVEKGGTGMAGDAR